jgi:hypothetical protein
MDESGETVIGLSFRSSGRQAEWLQNPGIGMRGFSEKRIVWATQPLHLRTRSCDRQASNYPDHGDPSMDMPNWERKFSTNSDLFLPMTSAPWSAHRRSNGRIAGDRH